MVAYKADPDDLKALKVGDKYVSSLALDVFAKETWDKTPIANWVTWTADWDKLAAERVKKLHPVNPSGVVSITLGPVHVALNRTYPIPRWPSNFRSHDHEPTTAAENGRDAAATPSPSKIVVHPVTRNVPHFRSSR